MEELAAIEQREKSNTRRIEKLEEDNEVLHKMATSIEVLAKEMEYVRKGQDELTNRMREIESEPKERLGQIISAVIVALVGLCVGYLAGGVS